MSPLSRMAELLRAPKWVAALGELTLIVVGILLALAIDQWRQSVEQEKAEAESLQLLIRDLDGAVSQLEEYVEIVDGTASSAAQVYRVLSGPRSAVDEKALSDLMLELVLRRTLRLPRAAYTDLLSTGNLRLIDRGEIRDAVIQFYESAGRVETILQRNTETLIDGQINPLLVGQGLILPRPVAPSYSYGLAEEAFSEAAEKLGADAVYPADPLWQLPANAREWDRIKSLSLLLTRTSSVNRLLASQLLDEAGALRELLSVSVPGGAS